MGEKVWAIKANLDVRSLTRSIKRCVKSRGEQLTRLTLISSEDQTGNTDVAEQSRGCKKNNLLTQVSRMGLWWL